MRTPRDNEFTLPTVMILAAGEGKRMLPLTATTPKPLLTVGGMSLLEHHLANLNRVFCSNSPCNVVINIAHLGQQIIDSIDHSNYPNLAIVISDERSTGALETAGGIVHALPLITTEHILVVNGDVFTTLNLLEFWQRAEKALQTKQAYLGMVKNPDHNPNGDFYIDSRGNISREPETEPPSSNRHTFAGIGAYQTGLFKGLNEGIRPLAPILTAAMASGLVSGELLNTTWEDVGTPERLDQLNQRLKTN